MGEQLIYEQDKTDEIIKKFNYEPTNLLPILLEVQELHEANYVPEKTAIYIAKELDIAEAKVSAAISFFSALSDQPRGKNIIKVCKSTACMVNNHENLLNVIKNELAIDIGETTPDQLFTLEMTECIGACDLAPAFKINKKVYGNLSENKIIEILKSYTDSNTKTTKVLSENFDHYNPESLTEYKSLGGFEALKKAFQMSSDDIIKTIEKSGLRGRGGAAYPTGLKLIQARRPKEERKVIICNADEGEPGTFKDRQFIEYDPFKIIEGMMITGYVVGANEGYIYIRHEYNHLHRRLHNVIERARKAGYLGKNVLETGFDFDIKVFSGAGAYICGEGGALIESMEGKIGYPRVKPPYTKQKGLHQLPTTVINVETLCSMVTILSIGLDQYLTYGTEKSPGTKLISISGNVNAPGAYEVEFGITIQEIIDTLAMGVKGNKQAKFIQIGGASGHLIPFEDFDVKLSYEDLDARGYALGSGAIVVCDEDQSVLNYLKTVFEFFEEESCGKCTPCREGHHLIVDHLNHLINGHGTQEDLDTIIRLTKHMQDSAFCGLGTTAPNALLSAVDHFKIEFNHAINVEEVQ